MTPCVVIDGVAHRHGVACFLIIELKIEVISVFDPVHGDWVFEIASEFRRRDSEVLKAVQDHFERSARPGEANLEIRLGAAGSVEKKGTEFKADLGGEITLSSDVASESGSGTLGPRMR